MRLRHDFAGLKRVFQPPTRFPAASPPALRASCVKKLGFGVFYFVSVCLSQHRTSKTPCGRISHQAPKNFAQSAISAERLSNSIDVDTRLRSRLVGVLRNDKLGLEVAMAPQESAAAIGLRTNTIQLLPAQLTFNCLDYINGIVDSDWTSFLSYLPDAHRPTFSSGHFQYFEVVKVGLYCKVVRGKRFASVTQAVPARISRR